jgi:hypothetical protein
MTRCVSAPGAPRGTAAEYSESTPREKNAPMPGARCPAAAVSAAVTLVR